MILKGLNWLRNKVLGTRKLTPEEMCVIIAQDVIDQLRSKKLVARPDNYVLLDDVVTCNDTTQVCDMLKNQTCTVCALGGLFVAACSRYNDLTAEELALSNKQQEGLDYLDKDNFSDYLEQFFEVEQLQLIEIAFEGWTDTDWADADTENYLYENYYLRFNDHEERMIAIMQNIIDNGGVFRVNSEIKHNVNVPT